MKVGDTITLRNCIGAYRLITLANEHMLRAHEKGLYERAANLREEQSQKEWLAASVHAHKEGFMLIHPDVLRFLGEPERNIRYPVYR